MFSIALLSISDLANCQTLETNNNGTNVDTIPNQNYSDSAIDSIIFTKVQNAAEFPGGPSVWVKYLQRNLDPNVGKRNGAPAGSYKVIVKFIVSKDGNIINTVANTNHGYGMEKEVIRIIEKGPKWTPAKQNGRSVNSYRRQPVTFIVSN